MGSSSSMRPWHLLARQIPQGPPPAHSPARKRKGLDGPPDGHLTCKMPRALSPSDERDLALLVRRYAARERRR